MKNLIWLCAFGLFLFGCKSEGGEASDTYFDEEDEFALEEEAELAEAYIGELTIDLPEDGGTYDAYCTINLIRVPEDQLASIILTFDIIGQGCDGIGNCEDDNMMDGRLSLSGGHEGANPFAMMSLGYEPPSNTEEENIWIYNVIFNSEPFNSFELWVDDQPFDLTTPEPGEAQSPYPEVWNSRIELEADMIKSSESSDQSNPGLQARGKFVYEGPCEGTTKIMSS